MAKSVKTTAPIIIAEDDPRIQALVTDWHETSRPIFAAYYPILADTHDTLHGNKKTIVVRKRYILLDQGTSGVFALDRTSGIIYKIKGYGVPNFIHPVGKLGEVTGADLHNATYMKAYGVATPRQAAQEAA